MQLISWLAFFSLWGVLIRYGLRIRVALLAAQVVNAVLIVLVTESLSAFQALTMWPLVVFWLVIFVFNLALLYRIKPARPAVSFDALEVVILIAVGFIVAVTGLIALVAPPNNYDSMIYHMSRVAHWAFNASVANYPTHILMQLVIQPFGEYAILQTYILSGSDYFANLVQWNSMVASLVGVSLIAEMLGGSRRVQLFSVLLAATLPMGILQASSTQNDYVATLWAICVAVFALLLVSKEQRRWGILCAFSFGLATFTKGIAVTLGTPFLIWALWRVRWKAGDKTALVFLVFATVLAMNAAFVHRLMEISPNPFEAMRIGGAVVERVDVRGMVSNAVRGMATELAMPSEEWSGFLLKAVEAVHHWLGLDINDPRFTVPGGPFLLLYSVPIIEDLITCPIHSVIYVLLVFYLATLAVRKLIVIFAGSKGVGSDHNVSGYKACGWEPGDKFWSFLGLFSVAVLLFCTLTKWQVWIPRFHLPFFVMFSAVAGVALTRFCARPWFIILIGSCLFIAAMVPLFYNQQRSVLPSGAVTRSGFARSVPRGGEIFDWLMKNGYFTAKTGEVGYINVVTGLMRDRLRQAYPVEYEDVWSVLNDDTLSFSRGLFFTAQEELLFGRFGKIVRDDVSNNIKFIRHKLQKFPECRDIGFTGGVIEYPLWSVLNSGSRVVRIEHILVENVSKNIPYPRGEPKPCLILRPAVDGPEKMEYHGRIFLRGTRGPYEVYVDESISQ